MTTLAPKQQAFVREYMLDSNGTQAAIRAGYSKKTAQEQSSRLLSKVIIREALQVLTDKADDEAILTVKEKRKMLGDMARVAMTDYYTMGADGTMIPKAAEDMTRAEQLNLGEMKNVITADGAYQVIKPLDKLKIIDLDNKMAGIYTETASVTNIAIMHVDRLELNKRKRAAGLPELEE